MKLKRSSQGAGSKWSIITPLPPSWNPFSGFLVFVCFGFRFNSLWWPTRLCIIWLLPPTNPLMMPFRLINIIVTGPLRLLSLFLFLDFVLAILSVYSALSTPLHGWLFFLQNSGVTFVESSSLFSLQQRASPSYSSCHSGFVIAFITISHDLVSLFNICLEHRYFVCVLCYCIPSAWHVVNAL